MSQLQKWWIPLKTVLGINQPTDPHTIRELKLEL